MRKYDDGFATLKIIVDNDNYTIVNISEEAEGFLFQYYDNGSTTHRLRETLEFKSIRDAIRFVKVENSCYEIIDDYDDLTDYY